MSGCPLDKETNLHYNGHRTYDPQLGIYTQPDPIGNVLYGDMAARMLAARGLVSGDLAEQLYSKTPVYNQSYVYVNNQPTRYVDPKGLQAMTIPVIVGGGTLACYLTPGCRDAISDLGKRIVKAVENFCASENANPPYIGPPDGWVQGPRRGRQYGPDGKPAYDIDQPHQGEPETHVHEWPNGEREHPGRPVSPLPQR